VVGLLLACEILPGNTADNQTLRLLGRFSLCQGKTPPPKPPALRPPHPQAQHPADAEPITQKSPFSTVSPLCGHSFRVSGDGL
jgi:hypothetical protein